MKIIEAKNLIYSYDGKKNVINDVSFSIESGQYVALIGHNGSGKSTLSRLLMGLLDPGKDTLVGFGLPYSKKNIREIRSHIGIVFQNPDNQFIGSTVRDDIAFGLENRRVKHDDMDVIIDDFAAKVNMTEFLDKEPSTLSGGQKQRVAIAGILAMNPDLVIFDEATAMLDPKGKREIAQTIEAMRKDNPKLTVISITHDVEEAFMSDRVIVLNEGKIVFDLEPKELIKHKDELLSIGLDIPFVERLKDKLIENNLSKVVEDILND